MLSTFRQERPLPSSNFLASYFFLQVLFAPLTCVELRGSRTEGTAIVFDMALSINLMAPSKWLRFRIWYPSSTMPRGSLCAERLASPIATAIEKVVAKLKTSHLDLLRLLQADFKGYGVPADALTALRQQEVAASKKEGAWFNVAANFQTATSDAFAARDAAFRWMLDGGLRAPCPRAFAALGGTVDAASLKPLAEREKLTVGTNVLALDVTWKGGVVTRMGNGTVDVKIHGWNEKKGLPLSKALVISEAGAGALLREAAASGNAALVDALLEADVSVFVGDARANTPLHVAAASGHVSICRALLAKGADATVDNMQNQDAAQVARSNKQLAVARVFQPQHSDKEFTDKACTATARLRAAAAGDVPALGKTKDNGKITALMVAARSRQLAVVEAVVASSIVNAQSASGCTALYLAAEEGDERIVRVLLNSRANVGLAASDGGTPLQRSCYFGHLEVSRPTTTRAPAPLEPQH